MSQAVADRLIGASCVVGYVLLCMLAFCLGLAGV